MTNKIPKQRLNAFQNQGGLCYYCKSAMWLNSINSFANSYSISISEAARFQCTAEHLTALSDGGRNKKNNVVAACIFCNKKRHARKKPPTPIKYQELIHRRIKQGKWHPKKLHHMIHQLVSSQA